MHDKKQFWSFASVLFLAIVMPTILRQVNKITRVLAGAEGRLAAINIETDRTLGKVAYPFVQAGPVIAEKDLEPDQLRSLYLKYGPGKVIEVPPDKTESYMAALGIELVNTGLLGKITIAHPATQVFENMGQQRLVLTGNGSWVYAAATKDANSYQVILSNYDPKGTHSEVVPVNFLNLKGSNFVFHKTFLGSSTTSETFSTDSGLVQKLVPMQPNSVAFLELEVK